MLLKTHKNKNQYFVLYKKDQKRKGKILFFFIFLLPIDPMGKA